VALLYDSTVSEGAKAYYREAVQHEGLTDVGIESFNVFATEFGPQLQRLKNDRPEALIVWGLASNTAGVVKQLDQLGAAFVDTPTAKGPGWRPHIVGAPTGTGDKQWVERAQQAAKAGSVTAWHLGGLVYLPTFAIRDWMKRYLNKVPTGGEELPADGLGTVIEAIRRGRSMDRGRIVSTIETMGRIK